MNASVMVGIMTLTPYESLLSGFCLSCQSHDCDSIRIDSELVQWPLLSNEKSTTMGPLLPNQGNSTCTPFRSELDNCSTQPRKLVQKGRRTCIA